MKKHLLLLFAIIVCVPAIWAVDQAYYKTANGKKAALLRDALSSITSVGPAKGHNYDNLWNAYKTTDIYPVDSVGKAGKIWDMYSNVLYTPGADQCGNYGDIGDCYNREHSLPKSWFGEDKPAYYDMGHIIPTDGKVNGQRSNYAFGECANGGRITKKVGDKTYVGAGKLGQSTFLNYTYSKVFEPDDQYKGDFARMYMYMRVRYKSLNMTQDYGWQMFNTEDENYGMTDYSVALLMKWHRMDPVSQKEIGRNNGMETVQGNRNPFIDYPILAEYLWGDKSDEVFLFENAIGSFEPDFIPGVSDGERNTTDPVIISPKGAILFGETNTTMSVERDIVIEGKNLEEGELTLTLEGDVEYFSLETYAVTSEQATEGYAVTATYAPTVEGQHSAQLIINGCGITNHIVLLTGSCVASHTITWESVDGTQYTTAKTGALPVLPSDIPTTCPDNEDRVFVGWTTDATYSDETTAPLDMFLEPVETIVEPVTYYAVYADKEVTGNSTTVTFTAGVDKGSNNTVTKDGVTCALSKTNGNEYYQIYSGASGTISSEENPITQIVFTCTGSGNSEYGPGKIGISVGDYSYEGYVGTWTGEAMSVPVRCNKQVRMKSIVVTVGSGSTIFSNFSLLCPEDDPSDIEEMHLATPVAQKMLVNGQLFIFRDGKIFTVQGVQIR